MGNGNLLIALTLLLSPFLALSPPPPAFAETTGAPQVSVAPARCEALAGGHPEVTDAPTEVLSARPVAATGEIPAYCEVKGYIAPYQQFELFLPMKWTGRYVQVGCGGMCGAPVPWLCDDSLRKGEACMAPALGHFTVNDSQWAKGNLQGRIDFGFRGVHVAALTGKALTRLLYGQPPRWSYFLGSSTGGRLAMVEAQRFPWDFNGIVSGVPIMNQTGDQMAILWGSLALRTKEGGALLTPDDIQMLHQAVLAACDMNDGVKDGLIGDPRVCSFDPGTLACPHSGSAWCLSPAKLAGIRKMYQGPSDSQGQALYPGGFMLGSELEWLNGYAGSQRYANSNDRFHNMAFFSPPPEDWKPTDFNWDEDYKRLDLSEALYGATNPDLRRFKAAGAKLIQFEGWADEAVLPMNTVDYYETVTRLMGGPKQTKDFYRLFMLPGMNHAGTNRSANSVDYASALESWVESGRAPDILIAAHLRSDPDNLGVIADGRAGKPGNSLRVVGVGHVISADLAKDADFTRPLYPYPTVARYKGQGDPNLATSFEPVTPETP